MDAARIAQQRAFLRSQTDFNNTRAPSKTPLREIQPQQASYHHAAAPANEREIEMQGEGKGATLSPQSRPAGSPRNPRVPSRATTSAFPDPPPRAARRLLPAGFPETPTTSTLSAASKLSPPKLSFPPSLCPLFFPFFFFCGSVETTTTEAGG
jgi:hypothetical protein